MSVSQSDFRAALLNPETPVPEGLHDAADRTAGRRFSVYRNNVTVSLLDALRVAFPLLRRLVGDKFDPLALAYLRTSPPSSPVMMFYGDTMPRFLASYEPLAHLGYLPDCARLDLALRRSYHAADCMPLAPEDLHIDPDTLDDLRLKLAPSSIVLRSDWPLFDIWRFTMQPGAPKPRAVAQDVLVVRTDYDPAPHLLRNGAAAWFEALEDGKTLGAAQQAVLSGHPDFDLAATLTLALDTGALKLEVESETP
ncbi:DNA-binding domain-containing protein [Sulfitobacter sp. D35]|uniref:DNA-binding domain-containing protein n=1 Tax=Sulfitobacter sp. D35 TaxID=3083252 RepID=UPI00296F098D|nr:DNA-binding domain-containing protein [Sulfitobacter sp. D35]MDW4499650.1 DNA-binding domain-containing protein [Sulfitobacter sp. D35]